MDIIDRLSIDPGKRTLGELLQDRQDALHEIKIRRELRTQKIPVPEGPADSIQPSAYATKTLLRLSEVCAQLSVSRSTVYKWMSEGTFPPPVRISGRAVRWHNQFFWI